MMYTKLPVEFGFMFSVRILFVGMGLCMCVVLSVPKWMKWVCPELGWSNRPPAMMSMLINC